MSLYTLFDTCTPRDDVLNGTITESDYAANLAQVLRNQAPPEYQDPIHFFANTHPTKGLTALLLNVSNRLSGAREQISSIFRLDTNFGGGKTHSLIALAHMAKGIKYVPNIAEFIDPSALPTEEIQVAAFDGENADPVNGHVLGDGVRAYTPWGEIAYALAGKDGYASVQKSDELCIAPGTDTISALFGGKPTLILIDELAIFLRKQNAKDRNKGNQLTAFLTSLFSAVQAPGRVALVYTLAVGKDDKKSIDAYSEENQFLARSMAELESVSARKATILDPTEDDETAKVLCRRLFQQIDASRAESIVDEYWKLWNTNKDRLPKVCCSANSKKAFLESYPLHPELIEALKEKISTYPSFQRVRGMLRLLAKTVYRLWKKRPIDAYAIHIHHIDYSESAIRQEILTRLQLGAYEPPLKADITAQEGDSPSLAEQLDSHFYIGLPPFTTYVARCIFFNTLVFNENARGVTENELRYSLLSPSIALSYIDDARRRFIQESAYLDDRPNRPLHFMITPNLTMLIRRQEVMVDPEEVRKQLNNEIKDLFTTKKNPVFKPIFFPAVPNEIEDTETANPRLVIIGYEATSVSVGDLDVTVPELVAKLFVYINDNNNKRLYLNNLVFLVADESRVQEMKDKIRLRIALERMNRVENQDDLADHQKSLLKEKRDEAVQKAAVCVQQTYRHIFYPSRTQAGSADIGLAHATIEISSAAEKPGSGQAQVIRLLQGARKLSLDTDAPLNPLLILQKTPLKNGFCSTADLRKEFHSNLALPILASDTYLIKCLRDGINQGEFVYKNGDLIFGKGDPQSTIELSKEALIYTAPSARENKIWPKEIVPPPPSEEGDRGEESAGTGNQNSGKDVDTNGDSIQIDCTRTPTGDGGTSGTGDSTGIIEISHEGVLKEVLTKIWEDARSKQLKAISTLLISFPETKNAFLFFSSASTAPNCEKRLTFDGSYETEDGSYCELSYKGTIASFNDIKDTFQGQLRAAKEKESTMTYLFTFKNGLLLSDSSPENFATKLTRIAGVAAVYVTATAKVDS